MPSKGNNSVPDKVDVLIAGAGPAGLAAANELLKSGASVLMVDARKKIGSPLRCLEITNSNIFELFNIEPRPRWTRWKQSEQRIFLNRPVFEYEVSLLLQQAGIMVRSNTSVVGVGPFDGNGRNVTLTAGSRKSTVLARTIIAADGVSSTVSKMCGIDTRLSLDEIGCCAAYRLADTRVINIDKHLMEFKEETKPFFYWIFITGRREAHVGVAVPGKKGFLARRLLDRYIDQNDHIQGGRIVENIAGNIPSTLPIEKPYTDGLLVTGTAARLIWASNGEGIRHAVISGREASKAIERTCGKSSSSDLLESYRKSINDLYESCYNHLEKRKKRDPVEKT